MDRARIRRRALPLGLAACLPLCAWLLAACGGGDDPLLTVRKLVTESRSDPVDLPGQDIPAATDTLVVWLGPDLARRDGPDGTFLIDAARGELTQVDHADRAWTSRTTQDVEAVLHALLGDEGVAPPPAGDDRLARLRGALKIAARVTETADTETIDGYRCRRWIVEQRLGDQHITSELWLTGDIDVDQALLHRATRPALLALPGGEAALAELARLRGVPVRSTSNIRLLGGEGRTETRLLAVETVRKPRSFFRPPADYRRRD